MDMVRGSRQEGEDGTKGESCMETYALPYVVESQWEFSVWLRGIEPGLCNNLEGWEGVGGGREVQEREGICVPITGSY